MVNPFYHGETSKTRKIFGGKNMRNVIERIEAKKPQSMPFYMHEYQAIYEAGQGRAFNVMGYAFALGYIKGREKGVREARERAKARAKA